MGYNKAKLETTANERKDLDWPIKARLIIVMWMNCVARYTTVEKFSSTKLKRKYTGSKCLQQNSESKFTNLFRWINNNKKIYLLILSAYYNLY